MTDELPEKLDPELAQLFSAEARFPHATQAQRARAWQRLESALALPALPANPGDAPIAQAATVGKASATLGLGKLLGVGAVTFVLGGVSGAAVYHAVAPPPAPVVIEVPVPAPALPEPSVRSPDASPSPDAALPQDAQPEPRELEKPRPRPSQPVEEPTTASELARERAIIDVVRAAIARGHADSALEAVARHAREFPEGRLREEREGLRVLALVRAGHREQAEAAMVRFKQRYPGSLLSPAIESALQEPH